MMTERLYRVGRHGVSDANKKGLAFASKNASLLEAGKIQARSMGNELRNVYGIQTSTVEVAVSELNRSPESAIEAGFNKLVVHPVLNEVVHGLELIELRKMLDEGKLPEAAIEKALLIRDNPPKQRVWITHGLVIAGLSHILGVHKDRRLIPRFGELREYKL